MDLLELGRGWCCVYAKLEVEWAGAGVHAAWAVEEAIRLEFLSMRHEPVQ